MMTAPLLAQEPVAPGASNSATGQDSPGDTTAADGESSLQDIVVTARRVNENLQRVPVAASVLGAEALQRQRVLTASDIQYNAPSLVITPDPLGGSSNPIFQLRGQTSPLGTDNTVVTYLADVPVDARVIAAGVFDMNSIQVIRGPQGTLFGKNSTGGAVLFTPQKADLDKITGFAQGGVGNYDFYQLTGAVNLPVVPGVFGVRISGQTTRQDGFVRNLSGPDGNDKHYDAARVAATLQPTDALRNEFLFTYFRGRQHLNTPITGAINAGLLDFVLTGIGYPPSVLEGVVADFNRQQQLGKRAVDNSFNDNPDNNTSYLFSNITSYDFGGVTLKNIFGYWKVHQFISLNQTSFSSLPIVDVSQDYHITQISDEVQLTGTSFNDSLNWIVGGFVSRQRTTNDQFASIFTTFPTTNNVSLDVYKSKALFAQATLDFSNFGLNGVKLTSGFRHTWDKRRGRVTDQFNEALSAANSSKGEQDSWTVGLDYQVTPDVLLYAATRRSYKAGGFNLISATIPEVYQVYKPETLQDVEIGAKTKVNLGSVPVRANLALYRGTYKNIHTQVVGFCGNLSSSLIVNAGKGRPKGLELEVEARLTPNLNVSGFYNRTLGKYKNFAIPSAPGCTIIGQDIDLAGQDFGNISRNTGGATVTYSLPLSAPREELVFTGNMYSRSKRLGNDLEDVLSPLPGYTTFNVRVDYNNIGGTAFSIGAFMKNIANKTYALTRNLQLSNTGYDTYTYGDPKTYGVEATYRF
jgi:iron complex outermembrane receptor protein